MTSLTHAYDFAALTASLAAISGRCAMGFDLTTQHPGLCGCSDPNPVAPMSEWAVFKAAVRKAVRDDGTLHQSDMRPLLRGVVAPKHIGQMYRRARSDGLLRDTGQREPSDDTAGRNADKLDRIYEVAR